MENEESVVLHVHGNDIIILGLKFIIDMTYNIWQHMQRKYTEILSYVVNVENAFYRNILSSIELINRSINTGG